MSVPQRIIPYKGIDQDTAEQYISEAHAYFIKNLVHTINENQDAPSGEGLNSGLFTPIKSNSRYCSLTLPSGRNFCCGFFESRTYAQGYVFVWNSKKNHLIYRINGYDGTCQVVNHDLYLNFQLDPRHFINEGRCTLQSTNYFNKVSGKEETRSFLIFTDDYNDQRLICVEDSIATDSFNGSLFPYFNTGDSYNDRTTWINLGVPMPMDCIRVSTIARDLDNEEEANKPNLINYKSWQFRIKEIDVWGRESEHGVISSMFINITGGGCIKDSNGLPRCLLLKFFAGRPFTDKIQIEYRNCTGNVRGLSVENDWYLYDTIEKWSNCGNLNWYERTINNPYQVEYDRLISLGNSPAEAEKGAAGFLRYYSDTNEFEYTFCNNKECTPIAFTQTNRPFNPLPHTSGCVFSLGNGIGLARNRQGFEPPSCDVLKKIKFLVNAPAKGTCESTKLRKVTIWIAIWNEFDNRVVNLRDDGGTPVFGRADCSNNNPFTYGQTLPKEQEGFILYAAGTKNFTITKQHRWNFITDTLEYTGVGYSAPDGNYIPIQVGEMELLPGRYILRLAGHRSKPTDDYQRTSTYLIGQTNLSSIGTVIKETSELVIDVCNDDVIIKQQPLMVYDLTRKGKGCLVAEATNVCEGYMREDEISKYPIELARIAPNIPLIYRKRTDHNGHYFAATRQKGLFVELFGQRNCQLNRFLKRSDISYDNSGTWYRYNDLYLFTGDAKYPVGDRFLIKGKISLCDDHNIGVNGAVVVLTNGSFATADVNGNFTIIAHEKGDTGGRNDVIMYTQRGTCQLLNCDNSCSYCFPNVAISAPSCNGLERIYTVPDLHVKVKGINKRGPQKGGRYGGGFKLHDWMGRHTFVEGTDEHYFDIPGLQLTQTYEYSTIGFTMPPDIQFDKKIKWISFYITENLAFDDFIEWVAERVQFIDNSGKTNTAAPTQIRLYYESLGEYNKQNNFSTNTVWQNITSASNPVLGDLVEFMINGDGVIFDKVITALVKYDKEGKYFLIDYQDELKDLKEGALIRLKRPKQCINKNFYYEVCPIIPLVDGKPTILEGTFNFFDSYMQNRQIPVPIEKTSVNETTGEIQTTTDVQIKSYPYLFEHHSPSDFWGDHCWNKGRVNVKNPYENRQILKMEIALSGVLTNNGILNSLHYFDDDNRKLFDEQDWQGIVAVIPELNTLLIICERQNFVSIFNDPTLQINDRGKVVVPSGEKKFSIPRALPGNKYGCQMEDLNTIRRGNGVVMFVDSGESALVYHDFSEARDVSVAGWKSWLNSKTKHILQFNREHSGAGMIKYYHGGIDPKNGDYLLTVFNITPIASLDEDFVNRQRYIDIELNETIAFNIASKFFKRSYSFTPEYYGWLSGDSSDKQLFTFRRGEAWSHYNVHAAAGSFNTFYDTPCDWVLEPVANVEPTKVKRLLSVEVYCKEVKIYADQIITETGQKSRLMPGWWDRRDKFSVADIKCDLNTQPDPNMLNETTINALLDGDVMYGRWARIRLVPHPDYQTKYCEITAVVINMIASEKSGG